MFSQSANRRTFLKRSMLQAGGLSLLPLIRPTDSMAQHAYEGPNVILVRFGGGVRRQETIIPGSTYAPYFLYELSKRGTLFTNMMLSQLDGVQTSHGQGTLYLLTGRYEHYQDIENRFLGQRFEPPTPTLFEYLRKTYDIPMHQTLIINGEDRTDEEFYSFSNHHLFGVDYRSTVLSLYRYKVYLLRQQIQDPALPDEARQAKQRELDELQTIDYRLKGQSLDTPEIDQFWANWRAHYGDSGFVNPRGDRLLAELSLRAMQELRPRLMMINFNDPDYVHWGNPSHYTLGISIIDQCLQRLISFVDHDEFYAGNTVIVIVPDCGRDDNRFMSVPFQHHFDSKSAHEIFALLLGPGIQQGVKIDDRVDQTSIAATIGHLMNMPADYTEGPVLEQALT